MASKWHPSQALTKFSSQPRPVAPPPLVIAGVQSVAWPAKGCMYFL